MHWAKRLPKSLISTFPSDMQPVRAIYFDGRSARARKVLLTLAGGNLEVHGEDINRLNTLDNLRVSEPMGAAPRLIKFPDGAHCEVNDHAALAEMLAAGGYREGVVVRLQQRWRWALGAVVIAVAVVVAGYRWGLPAISEWIANQLPESALTRMGESTLKLLDKSVFSPSSLPANLQVDLIAAFERLHIPDDIQTEHTVVFRDGRGFGANAMALPDGTLVVTDQLVKLAGHDEEILAVLAHELGHLYRRHSLRMLIQGSIVGAVVAWYVGDVSSVAAGLPTLMLQMRYSRDHEREADAYAARMLQENGISPARLADMLARLEQAHESGAETKMKTAGESGFSDYFASHPATRERIRALEKE